ncbi:DUF1937 family protein [Cereibacter johrii]|uniref:DUF1937 family protein n=1 Tax=Cereibacter johrii TaxID=445629 RepID=UPI000DCBABBA|nr:DUF1937 family protein [Cereibacter johrii]RAZ84429.1 DUF1937 domain-containing protein [Cereibacter johrii]
MTVPLHPTPLSRVPDWAALRAHPARDAGLLHFGAGPALVARRAKLGRPVYLATPYSLRAVDREGRWSADMSAAAMGDAGREIVRLQQVGVTAISPVALSGVAVHATLYPRPVLDPLDAVLWAEWCRPILDSCSAVVVPDIRGWSRSLGIWHEVRAALARQTSVFVYAERPEQ